jgi:hypothetical protein
MSIWLTWDPVCALQYLLTLQAMKNENKELKDKNRYLEERSNKDKVAQKREERLLMSALYEVSWAFVLPVRLVYLGLTFNDHRLAWRSSSPR